MANKVYENSQLICKYFKDAGIVLHMIKRRALRSRFTVFQLVLHRIYIGHHHAVTSNTEWYHVPQ